MVHDTIEYLLSTYSLIKVSKSLNKKLTLIRFVIALYCLDWIGLPILPNKNSTKGKVIKSKKLADVVYGWPLICIRY